MNTKYRHHRTEIQKAADEALEIHRNGKLPRPEMREAIHKVAERRQISASTIGEELSRRAQCILRKKEKMGQKPRRKVPPLPFEEEMHAELDRIEKIKHRGQALSRESWLQKSFRDADHLDDY